MQSSGKSRGEKVKASQTTWSIMAQFRSQLFPSSCLTFSICLIPAVVFLLCQPPPCRAIILCDGDCMTNTDLEICRPFNDSRTPIYVMAFFPCNIPNFRARGFTVAAQMAIRAVQNNGSILQDYSLRLAFNNTKVSE